MVNMASCSPQEKQEDSPGLEDSLTDVSLSEAHLQSELRMRNPACRPAAGNML